MDPWLFYCDGAVCLSSFVLSCPKNLRIVTLAAGCWRKLCLAAICSDIGEESLPRMSYLWWALPLQLSTDPYTLLRSLFRCVYHYISDHKSTVKHRVRRLDTECVQKVAVHLGNGTWIWLSGSKLPLKSAVIHCVQMLSSGWSAIPIKCVIV
jgi:hypothetical protein